MSTPLSDTEYRAAVAYELRKAENALVRDPANPERIAHRDELAKELKVLEKPTK